VRVLLPVLVATLALVERPLAQPSPAPNAALARFVGTWVGTQGWAIPNPPPGSRQDQPVTLIIENVDGRLRGTMRPFLGGEEGATFVDARIVGEELLAQATAGRGGRGRNQTAVSFSFTNQGLVLTGTADVKMGDVPWMKFRYDLSRKRSRY
jgi:hypothetical protein